VVATYRESDTNPKEQFIYHCAVTDGYGGSSYIDAVILRDQDANTNWVTTAADGVLEKRDYYCQNWRADVVTLITSSGGMGGWVKYSAYGIPYGIPAGDTNGDGVVNSTDSTNATSWAGTGAGITHPTADINLDGNINSTDQTAIGGVPSGVSLGWGKLSEASATGGGAAGGNRKGYAGYEFDHVLADSNWHVRHRPLKSNLGRWMRRDPIGYEEFTNLEQYVRSAPLRYLDPTGEQESDGQNATTPSIHAPFMPDRSEVRCATHWIVPGLGRHCWIQCCPGNGEPCHTYSLENEGQACMRKDWGPDLPGGQDTGSESEVEKIKRGKGLCACAEAAYRANNGCHWIYDFGRCNSNWYAGSVWQCCTGSRGSHPHGAYHWDASFCCQPHIPESFFKCPAGMPGAGQVYNNSQCGCFH